jgi:tripartite-type tricarboxylate transporter receptor subunit TctC
MKSRTFLKAMGLTLLCASALSLSAQTAQPSPPYPSKPIKLLVGVPPGGSTDTLTRMFAAWLQDSLGQPTIVDNRPGANTAVAADAVARSAPDGYTLLVASDAYITVPLLTKLNYDPFKDFTPVGTMTVSPFVFAVHPSTPIKSVKDLIAYAKSHPGQLNYGSSGNGGASHLGGEKFKMLTGTHIVHIPYRGAGPALTDGIAGQFQLSLWTPLAITQHVQGGKLRALAITGSKRLASMPDVPTFAEAGLPNYEHRSWLGVFVPAGTPRPIVDKLNAEIKKATADPDVASKLSAQVLDPMYMTPEAFARQLKSDYDRLKQVVKLSGARIE